MYSRMALSGFAMSGLAALGLAMSGAANAEQKPGFYVGAGVGQTTLDFDADDDFTVPGLDDSDTSFKVYAGYTFNEFISVEVTYVDAGELNNDLGSGLIYQAEVTALNFSVIGHLPLTESWELFGRAGIASYDADISVQFNGLTFPGNSDSDQDVSYGFGAAYMFAAPFELRAEYEIVELDTGSFDSVSLGGVYKF